MKVFSLPRKENIMKKRIMSFLLALLLSLSGTAVLSHENISSAKYIPQLPSVSKYRSEYLDYDPETKSYTKNNKDYFEYQNYGCYIVNEKEKTVDIVYYIGEAKESFTFPSEINGYRVVSVGGSSYYHLPIIRNAQSIKKLSFPEGIKSIGHPAEEDGIAEYSCIFGHSRLHLMDNVEKVVLPETIEEIYQSVFSVFTGLKKVNLPSSLRYIGWYAFANTALSGTVKLPESLKHHELQKNYIQWECVFNNIGSAFKNTDVTAFSISRNNKEYKTSKGVLYSKDGSVLEAYPAGRSNKTFTLSAKVKTVAAGAFAENRYLEKIYIKSKHAEIQNTKLLNAEYHEVISETDADISLNTSVYCQKYNSPIAKHLKDKGYKVGYIGDTQVINIVLTKALKNGVRISWAGIDKAEKYRVYQSTDGKSWKKVRVVKGPSAKVSNLKSKTGYYFKVVSVVDGQKVKASPSLKIKTK